ncbi:helicase C-terminal domain-containing protein [Enterococcus sp. HY326]|uniref:helicase C-terminal domain-containing protein n=1 Tax=Enterococcus sp. HY326 TaxID=2971265 RepID=UPI00223E9935|nr:helicase C-terminal domain-containing protein [Enterococcus sp. HY326]
MKSRTYAVVDIETTGTDHKTDRIIQFGCVLVEDGEIVSRFATDINPDQKISKQIQSLTGITNSQVQKAPYFEDVALTIYNLLADTTFVAHNIYFDYNFLNAELVRCGLPELAIPGIDTVELAQIFLPTEASFRLKDLSDSLGLVHENPHQADSDAEVTAQLFIKITEKIRSLPVVTLQKISELSSLTGMETSQYISELAADVENQEPELAEHLEIVAGIALRKKTVNLFSYNLFGQQEYPKSNAAKRKLFNQDLELRKDQGVLMNQVYRHFTDKDSEKNLLVEAALGMGKTIGYLLPLSFLATPENPAIISTASIVLQQQIMDKDIPLLNQVLPQEIQGTLVKSPRHFLNLQSFQATLAYPVSQKQYALYQMAVLVWLTETATGDFEELQMTNLNHAFWEDVAHQGLNYLAESQELYQEDFLLHLHRKMAQSNFLIVNHAYLSYESLRNYFQLPKSSYLLIDEAHHLGDDLEKASQQRLSLGSFQKKAHHQLAEGQFFDELQKLIAKSPSFAEADRDVFQLYRQSVEDLLEEQQDFAKELLRLVKRPQQRFAVEEVITEEDFELLSDFGFSKLKSLKALYQDILLLQQRLETILQDNLEHWTLYQRKLFSTLANFFQRIKQQTEFFTLWTENWQGRYVHWLIREKNNSLSLMLYDYQAAVLKETKWYERYQKILYIGGTIRVGSDRQYFPKRWGLNDAKVKIIKSPYDYSQQARLFVPKEAVFANQIEQVDFINFLAETLLEIADNQQERILVLFTSHEVLQQVYFRIQGRLLDKGRELFAQNINGTREKLLKRFFLSDSGILLGADSFWEGIDLPGDTLKLLIVTRLPFDNPRRPLTKARNQYLESQGINPFYQESLPKTALKLKQALGRLIRSKKDYGVMIVLDRRLVSASYGKRIIKVLPEDLPIEELALTDLLSATKDFLEKKSKNF